MIGAPNTCLDPADLYLYEVGATKCVCKIETVLKHF